MIRTRVWRKLKVNGVAFKELASVPDQDKRYRMEHLEACGKLKGSIVDKWLTAGAISKTRGKEKEDDPGRQIIQTKNRAKKRTNQPCQVTECDFEKSEYHLNEAIFLVKIFQL